jgi:hypothetical protein
VHELARASTCPPITRETELQCARRSGCRRTEPTEIDEDAHVERMVEQVQRESEFDRRSFMGRHLRRSMQVCPGLRMSNGVRRA